MRADGTGSSTLSRQEIDNLKAGVRLEDLAARYVQSLRRVGERWVGLCPFHDDTEPSFNIWPDSQSWYCFGACRRGGDVVDLLREAEGVDFRHALELLGGPPAGTSAGEPWQPPLPLTTARQTEAEPGLDCQDRSILNAASEIYFRSLMGNVSVRRAIEGRAYTMPQFKHFTWAMPRDGAWPVTLPGAIWSWSVPAASACCTTRGLAWTRATEISPPGRGGST